MKKLLSLILSLMMLLSLTAFAEEEVPANRILAVDSVYLGLADMYPQFKGTESTIRGCLGLQPYKNEDGTFQEGYMLFTVIVDAGGQYDVTVRYAAKYKTGQTRCADMIVNEGERIHLPIVGQAEWTDYVDATVTVELVEGLNSIILTNVEGFDNSVYKAINVDYIEWLLTPETLAE